MEISALQQIIEHLQVITFRRSVNSETYRIHIGFMDTENHRETEGTE
jgi:hypothetical protein